jgi:hypothetical protein
VRINPPTTSTWSPRSSRFALDVHLQPARPIEHPPEAGLAHLVLEHEPARETEGVAELGELLRGFSPRGEPHRFDGVQRGGAAGGIGIHAFGAQGVELGEAVGVEGVHRGRG